MKIWAITFTGVYPVGSAAIVVTLDHGDAVVACGLFRDEWRSKYRSSPEPVKARLLDCGPGAVHILVDGDY